MSSERKVNRKPRPKRPRPKYRASTISQFLHLLRSRAHIYTWAVNGRGYLRGRHRTSRILRRQCICPLQAAVPPSILTQIGRYKFLQVGDYLGLRKDTSHAIACAADNPVDSRTRLLRRKIMLATGLPS
jgi:hypothetical protein